MIPFNIPPQVGTELDYMRQAMANNKICGDGPFTRRCDEWMEQRFHAGKVLLTTSGTTALEMAALLCGIQPGDEVNHTLAVFQRLGAFGIVSTASDTPLAITASTLPSSAPLRQSQCVGVWKSRQVASRPENPRPTE